MASFVRVYLMRANRQTVVTSHAHSIHVSEVAEHDREHGDEGEHHGKEGAAAIGDPSLCASCTRM